MKGKVDKIFRICEVCHKEFSCYPSQSKNKTVCSMACYRQRQKNTRVMVHCKQCGKTFELPPSLVKADNFCSQKCLGKYKTAQGLTHACCLNCGITFVSKKSWKQKFCSLECSQEYRKKHSTKKQKTCEICGRVFTCSRNKPGRFCSRECQWIAQSRGLVKSHSYGHYGYREDLGKTFRSSLEANFARVCNYLNLHWEYEPYCFITSLGRYTPDFYIDEWKTYVETRGHKKRSLDKAKLAAELYKFELKIVYEEDFLRQYGSLKDKIPFWESNNAKLASLYNPEFYEQKTCRGCGKIFVARKTATNKKLYCSITCANKHKWEHRSGLSTKRHKAVIRKCLNCGKDFRCIDNSTQKYCSRKCYWETLGNVSSH